MSDTVTTPIKSFANYAGAVFVFNDLQSGHKKTVTVPKITTQSAYMEIPICNSASDFGNGNYITVTLDGAVQWYVWQHKDTDGDCIRCSATGYVPGAAPTIDGSDQSGGTKGIAVLTNGTLSMTTYVASSS